MKTTRAKVLQVSPLTNTIIRVVLEPHEYIDYKAGQYLKLITGTTSNFFSIANAPLGAKTYELHIRHEKNHQSTEALLKFLQKHGEVELELPLGRSHIGSLDANKPIIFVAGGTGFAPIKAVIEQLLYQDDTRAFECYWSAKVQSDLYWQQQLNAWLDHVASFKHLELFEGKKSLQLIDKLTETHARDLGNYQFLISGPFDMVYDYRDKLQALGVDKQSIFSDAFEFEKDK